jgi:hypothetical protein
MLWVPDSADTVSPFQEASVAVLRPSKAGFVVFVISASTAVLTSAQSLTAPSLEPEAKKEDSQEEGNKEGSSPLPSSSGSGALFGKEGATERAST